MKIVYTDTYIGIRESRRKAGQFYEFWDANIGYADIHAGEFYANEEKVWHAGNFDPASKLGRADSYHHQSASKLTGGGMNQMMIDGLVKNIDLWTLGIGNLRAIQFGAIIDEELKFYERYSNGENWSDFVELWHSGNFNPTLKADVSQLNLKENIPYRLVACF